MSTEMTFPEYYSAAMKHLNELHLAYSNATADTWPELRDQVLREQDMMSLSHLQYDDSLPSSAKGGQYGIPAKDNVVSINQTIH